MENCVAVNELTVSYLKGLNFTELPVENQLEVKRAGRPQPRLNIKQVSSSKTREFRREFKPDIYAKTLWLCGCEVTHKLFCYPCLLFAKLEGDTVWIKHGVSDLSHLTLKIKKHESSQSHLNSVLDFNLVGRADIRLLLDRQYRLSLKRKREGSVINRCELSKTIRKFVNSCYDAFHKSTLASDDTNVFSPSSDVFKSCTGIPCRADASLKQAVSISIIFTDVSSEMRKDLLDCMLSVCQEHIKKEIRNSSFVSIIINETLDACDVFRYALVFRYVSTEGEPVERFWDLITVDEGDATSLARRICDVLDGVVSLPYKVISQSFDGSVMSCLRTPIQAVIKHKYSNAHYVHCYAHRLDTVVEQTMRQIPQLDTFFTDVCRIINYLINDSPLKIGFMDEIMGSKFQKMREEERYSLTWNFLLNTIHAYRAQLITNIDAMAVSSSKNYDLQLLNRIKSSLQDQNFLFWLGLCRNIMFQVDVLSKKLWTKNADGAYINKHLEAFLKSMEEKESDSEDCVEVWPEREDGDRPGSKRMRSDTGDARQRTSEAAQVKDLVMKQMKAIFSFSAHYNASSLFDPQRFHSFDFHFPHQILDQVIDTYPFLEKDHLKTELCVLYRRTDVRGLSGAVTLLQFLLESDLETVFSETYKLLLIVTSVPLVTLEPDRRFNTLRNIETLVRNVPSRDISACLAMVTLENGLVSDIPNFDNSVIDLLASVVDQQ